MRKGDRIKNEMMRRWEYTSDETGACVSKFAAQVVRDVNRESAIRVCVRRGDGKKLVEMLRSGLPNTKIELTPMALSLSAKLDVSVQVWEGQNERLVWELCNVAAVATQWTLKDYYEWAKKHRGDPALDDINMDGLLECLSRLLGYGQYGYGQDTSWWAALELDVFPERFKDCEAEALFLESLHKLCGELLQANPDNASLVRCRSAIDAGIDAAHESIDNAEKARKK
jgi:hypothetical protein